MLFDSSSLFLRRAAARTLLALTAVLSAGHAAAQTCAPPSSLGSTIPAGVINDYYPGSGQATVNAGATTLALGTRDARGAGATLAVGDLLMVVQMQDGSYTQANNSTFGDGTGSGSGATSLGNAGYYEFVRITAVAGSNVTFTPALTRAYADADATASAAQRRYQVVRVPQYASGTAAGVLAPPWNGRTGGAVALDVRDTLTLGGATVEGQTNRAVFVAGKGFRGGFGLASGNDVTAPVINEFMTAATAGYHASKGEGILGTPKYVAVKNNGWGFQTTAAISAAANLSSVTQAVEGYPNGSYARGAPGNAGGGGVDSDNDGGNSNNSGGGGGGNYGPGGIGGRPWNSPLLDLGGRGGAGYAGTLAFNRIFMGGGGGAGSTNNATSDAAAYTNLGIGCSLGNGTCSSGAAGGGLVVIRARAITGSGVIDARGAHAYNVLNDSAGGGGGGGSVVLHTQNGGNATVDVSGGDGGNAWAGNNTWPGGRHGPGGAGGGGFVAYSPNTMAVAANVNGGTPGETMSNAGFEEYYGSTGFNGGITTFQTPNVPGVPPAATCEPNLSLRKSNGVTSLVSPGTSTYAFTVYNTGTSQTTGTLSIADRLPTGLSVTPGALTVTGTHSAAWTCTAANATDITCQSVISVPAGGSSSFALAVSVNGSNGTAVVNKAVVRGGGDSTKTGTASVTQADSCTANDTPAGCAVDADTITAPNLTLTKTDGAGSVAAGQNLTYTLVVTNGGGTATSGTIRVADALPSGLTYSGSTPFSSGGFTCTVAGQGITCDRATALAAGASTTITFTTLVGSSVSAVVNHARVGGGGDPNPTKSTLPTTTTAAACPDPVPPATTSSDDSTGCAADATQVGYVRLELAKDDGQVFVSTGGSTVYQFTVRNIGTYPSTGTLNFGDVLPTLGTGTMQFSTAGTFSPGGANGADWSCTRSTGTYTYCTSAVPIPAGSASVFNLTVTLSATVPAGTDTLNRARIGGGGDVRTGMVNSPTVANITACVGNGNPLGCAIDLNTTQTAPEVRLTKSHPNPQARSVGNAFTFTLVISNSGGSAAATNSVRMIDVVPAGLTIGTVSAGTPFTCATAGQVITCNNSAGALAAGASATISVPVTVAAAATNPLLNRAKVSATGDPQNNTVVTQALASACVGQDAPAFGCATDLVPLNADLQVLKEQRRGNAGTFQTALLGVALNDTVQYRISVANAAGSAAVSTVTLSDLVPFHLSSLAVGTVSTAGGASGCVPALAGSQVNATVASLPAGSSCSFIVQGVATTNTAGTTNTVALTLPTGIVDTNPANNSATVVTAVGSANLSVVKSNGTTTVVAGGTTDYVITVANGGPSPANGTTVYDPPSAGLSCTDVTCSVSGSAVCPAGTSSALLTALQTAPGLVIPTLPAAGAVNLTVRCTVTATGN